MPQASIDRIMNTRVPIAALREQTQISQYLDKKSFQINSLIERIERKIELHNEY